MDGKRNGNGVPPPVQPPTPTGPGDQRVLGVGREMSIDRNVATGQPVVVNFVLDGETIMQAVVRPERLRPVVEEIQRRDRWR